MKQPMSDKHDPPANTPMIEMRHVHKWYGDFHVLEGINLEVGKRRKWRRLRAVRIGQVEDQRRATPAALRVAHL